MRLKRSTRPQTLKRNDGADDYDDDNDDDDDNDGDATVVVAAAGGDDVELIFKKISF
jgi:hypothetical protein